MGGCFSSTGAATNESTSSSHALPNAGHESAVAVHGEVIKDGMMEKYGTSMFAGWQKMQMKWRSNALKQCGSQDGMHSHGC